MNDFLLMIQTALDSKGIKSDYNKLKQMFDKDPTKINAVMDMSATKTQINKFIKEYAPQLQKMFKGSDVDVNLKDLESSMKSVFVESEKAVKSLANAEKQAHEMNKTYDKQKIAEKNKMRLDELQAYKDNESFDKKLYLNREQAYKQNESNTRKMGLIEEQAYKDNINRDKKIFLNREQAYKQNESNTRKMGLIEEQAYKDNINRDKKIFLNREQAYKTNDTLIKKQAQERIATEKQIQTESKKTSKLKQDDLNLKSNKIVMTNNLDSYLKNNTKLSTDLKNKLLEIRAAIQSADKTQLKNLKNELRETTSVANKLGQSGDSFGARLVKNSKQLLNFLGSATIIMGAVNSVRGMITNVAELDKSMIGLKKVTDEADITYEKFLDNAAQKAKNLGATISDVVNMTAEWAKAGYNLQDSENLASVSTIFTNVGDVDAATAVKDIVTPLKAFNLAASEAIEVVNKLNSVDNEFAVNSADIGTGLANSASALALAGNDINQSIALITGGSEITQNASETGNAVKVLSMRLRGRHTCLHMWKHICYVR